MAGKNVIQGAQPVEYLEETSYATPETDGSWNWLGIGTSWSVDLGVESESITYLPEYNASNKLEKRMNVKHREMYEGEATYHPQDFDILPYFTGADGGTSDDPPTIQFGEVNESVSPEEFRRMYGGMGEDFSLSVGEDETAEVTSSFIFTDAEDWGTTDYVGAGSHASEDTTEPFKYDDLNTVTYGGTSLDEAVESLELSVSQDVAVVRDPRSSNSTLIDALIPVDREITVSMDVTYTTFDMQSEVRSYTRQDLVFDLGGYSFTIEGVQFPESPYEFTADDLVSDSIESDPAASLTWTSP